MAVDCDPADPAAAATAAAAACSSTSTTTGSVVMPQSLPLRVMRAYLDAGQKALNFKAIDTGRRG
ncbi:hypothetical protein TSOC_010303, partial [Tetrabaena socialis]